MLVLPSQAGMAAFEEQVQTLWHISADSHHICRVYGVSCLDKQACVVMKLYPHSLVNKMMSASGQLTSSISLTPAWLQLANSDISLVIAQSQALHGAQHRLKLQNPLLLRDPTLDWCVLLGDRRKLPIQLVIQWGIDICQGLQDLHAAGIIMRNLKQVCRSPLQSCLAPLQLASSTALHMGKPTKLYIFIDG